MQHFERKVDSDGGSVVRREELVDVPLDNGRLPRSKLTDYQNFVQVLVLVAHLQEEASVRRLRYIFCMAGNSIQLTMLRDTDQYNQGEY